MTSATFSLTDTVRRAAVRLARPDILFWTLPLMMVLLVVGTVAQKDQGLFLAHETYFASFIVWFGLLPFPGGYTLMMVFFVNLLAKFLMFSEWQWRKAGVIITHFGAILLMIGGGFTALTQNETYLVVAEGETTNLTEDYHQRQLQIVKDDKPVLILDHQQLKDGMIVSAPDLPFTLTINKYCYSCDITRRAEDQQQGWTSPGRFMQLNAGKLKTNDEENLTGIEFTVNGLKQKDSRYVTFDKFPKPPIIEAGGTSYKIMIGREAYPLPFAVTLNKFTRTLHPGTTMASAFQSDISIDDAGTKWPASISMNEPLRHKGYTLYQSSFDLSGEKPFTVLHVVRNRGRIFPYAASLIMALGLLLHLGIRIRQGAAV